MKFFHKKSKFYTDEFESNFFSYLYDFYFDYGYKKSKIKNNKNLLKIRPGISTNKLKNSIKRDKNNNLLDQFININQRKGKKISFFKNINLSFENFSSVLTSEFKEFEKYALYHHLCYIYDTNPFFSDLNFILDNFCYEYKSIFEIKSIKNNKKSKSNDKYTHEIVYIPLERRLKYVLKSLSIYKEYFQSYNLWERLFWSLIMNLLNKNPFLKKRKEFIYLKSVKFFKKKIKKE